MISDAKDVMLSAITLADEARARSQQEAIGPSALGSCARAVWFKINKVPKTNKTDRLEAIMGTAIHNAIEFALKRYSFDTYDTEVFVEYQGMPAHIDWWRPDRKEIVDWKTSKTKNAAYFPKQSQIWQVQTYGYIMEANGYEVEQVTLVALMRDGSSDKILTYSVPYQKQIALDALAWLDNICKSKVAPAPEMDGATFCMKYCEWYGINCAGIVKNKKRQW